MNLETCLACLRETCDPEPIAEHWDESVAALPAKMPSWLTPGEIRAHREYCGLDASADEPLSRAAVLIWADPALKLLAWHCYRRLYVHTDSRGFSDWPSMRAALGDLAGALYVLVSLAMVPQVKAAHTALGVADEVTRDTCFQVECFALNYRDAHDGQWGILLGQLFWLRHYTAGRLFRIGRFEYMIRPYHGPRAYRHERTRDVVALADDATRFNAEGFIPIGEEHSEGDFTATLEERDGQVIGYPISPGGMAVDQRVTLDLAQWQPGLARGDLTLDMHIPSGGGMTPEACRDSLTRAPAFFAATFPDRHCVGVSCVSWIYNTQFEDMLGPEANLVGHMRELYLYPVHSSGRDGLYFLFYTDDVDPATARRDSSVRRAVLDHLAAGNRLRCGGMFTLTEDVARYGTDHYRSRWPEVLRTLGD
jgi:hypothetical protein